MNMARPIILGVVGDSATGKTTLTKGLVEILGRENVTHIGMDDYHCYDRTERAEHKITPLNPDCNYMDIIGQHLAHLRKGEPILKPVYQHGDGTFGRPKYVEPQGFVLIEGLLGYHTSDLSANFDVRVFLAPPESLRRDWKVKRDTTKRGYSEEQVLAELDTREPDSEAYIRPQRSRADIVVSFQPGVADDPDHLDAVLTLRDGLPHPDLASMIEEHALGAITFEQGASELRVHVPGNIDRDRGAAIEEAIWEQMHFARHLRTEQLGTFAVGADEAHRSESLAITQVLILYHLVTAKASVAVGGDDVLPRKGSSPPSVTSAA
jgi:phosphoribulokinase